MRKYRVPRETDRTKWEKVTGDWRQLHIEELHDLHCSPSIILGITLRRMRWAGRLACMGIKQNADRIFMRRTGHTTWNTQTYLSQYLNNLMYKIRFTVSFISCLYMFRARIHHHHHHHHQHVPEGLGVSPVP